MELYVKYVIVIQKEGCDVDWVKESINKEFGEVTEMAPYKDGDDFDVWEFFVTGSLAQFTAIKLKWNCVTSPESSYVLFPMATMGDKILVEQNKKNFFK